MLIPTKPPQLLQEVTVTKGDREYSVVAGGTSFTSLEYNLNGYTYVLGTIFSLVYMPTSPDASFTQNSKMADGYRK